jgi:hypothetical protein
MISNSGRRSNSEESISRRPVAHLGIVKLHIAEVVVVEAGRRVDVRLMCEMLR